MNGKLAENVKITKVFGTVATATTTATSTTVDMKDFDGVMFVGSIGTADVGNGVQARQGAASNMSDGAALEGTKILSDGTKKTFVLDIFRPRERYVDFQVIRAGATTTIEAGFAIQYHGSPLPKDSTSTDVAVEMHSSPAEGTP